MNITRRESFTRRHFAKLLAASPLAFVLPKVGQAKEEPEVKLITEARLYEVSVVKDNDFGTKLEVGYDQTGFVLPDLPTYYDEYGNTVSFEWLSRKFDGSGLEFIFKLEPFERHFINDEGYVRIDEYNINPIYCRGEMGTHAYTNGNLTRTLNRELQNAKYGLYRCFERAIQMNDWMMSQQNDDGTFNNYYAPLNLPHFGIEQYDFKLDLSRIVQI